LLATRHWRSAIRSREDIAGKTDARQMILTAHSLAFPHHFNGSSATYIIENFIEPTGEVLEIDRASLCGRSAIDQIAGGRIV
jgi:hypothetical protein